MSIFHTSDRRLEQFLYAHFIPFERQSKDLQGQTVWSYPETPRLKQVVAEYSALIAEYGVCPRRQIGSA